jgi:cytidyltransferase-like protein
MHLIQAIVLENLIKNNKLNQTIINKNIGYYLGSFDPIHNGHENVIQNILDKKLCDLVIIYPAWGGDKYKNRTDINIRLEMLFSIFKNNKKVIVTKLNPQELQKNLININAKYIGIIGSDLALYGVKNKKAREEFMSGKKITKEFKEHTQGCIMALPVKSFIVAIRSGDSIKNLNNKIGNRKILAIVETKFADISSTKIRDSIKNKKPINSLVNHTTDKIIKKYKLYQN